MIVTLFDEIEDFIFALVRIKGLETQRIEPADNDRAYTMRKTRWLAVLVDALAKVDFW